MWTDVANPWVERLPVYEPGRPIEEVAREWGYAVDAIDKLASNENALGPSPRAMQAMQASIADMHRYPDGGAFYLKQALADKLGILPDQILPGNGSNELLELIGHVFLAAGADIVMADRAFVVYRLIANACRADVISVPMDHFTHDLGAMLEAITPNTKVVFVSNPNNPTGTMVDQAAIDAFMAAVPEHVVVCFDEAYIELLPEEYQPDTLKYVREGRPVIVLRTFSKTYGLAGLRIGYAVGPEPCIKLLNRVRQPFNVNAMAMRAAIAALSDDEFVMKTRQLLLKGIQYLTKHFDMLGLSFVPTVTNFIMVEVGNGRAVFESLQREGVIVRPLDGYGLPEYVRVTVGTAEENRKFVKALGKVLAR